LSSESCDALSASFSAGQAGLVIVTRNPPGIFDPDVNRAPSNLD